jgi:UDP-N-acetylmuramoyl-tripeptide--D-alanyl-D-alanine ligase
LAEIKGRGRAIAVLGDMLELGEFSEEAHLRLGQKIKECAIDLVILLGEKAPIVVASAVRHGLEPERVRVVKSHSEALALLHQLSREGDWILVKGSRGMTMEKIAGVMKEGRA